jgi:hypothetical protein
LKNKIGITEVLLRMVPLTIIALGITSPTGAASST